jgi:hypothetical protein
MRQVEMDEIGVVADISQNDVRTTCIQVSKVKEGGWNEIPMTLEC